MSAITLTIPLATSVSDGLLPQKAHFISTLAIYRGEEHAA